MSHLRASSLDLYYSLSLVNLEDGSWRKHKKGVRHMGTGALVYINIAKSYELINNAGAPNNH
jgi:hypothetical protein